MTRVGRYTLGSTIHAGAKTVVLHAKCEDGHSAVVLKMPRAEIPSTRSIARVHHEYDVLRHLSEAPAVVRALGVETRGGVVALVLEFVPWKPLDQVLAAHKKLDVPTALRVGSLSRVRLRGYTRRESFTKTSLMRHYEPHETANACGARRSVEQPTDGRVPNARHDDEPGVVRVQGVG